MVYRKVLVFILPLIFLFISCDNNPSASQNQDSNVVLSDIDGNEYKTVKIGEHEWMAENLKVTNYRNGDAIPNITDNTEWKNLTTGAYCYYDNDANNGDTYGALYNWYTVDDTRGIPPDGWHVPTNEEWDILVNYLGGVETAGGKLKESGTNHWSSPNLGATNETGFKALPGGLRDYSANFRNKSLDAYFWSRNEEGSLNAWLRNVSYYHSEVDQDVVRKHDGFSIRCIKD